MTGLREKVARLIDPVSFSMTPGHYGLENEADFKRTMAYGAQLVASRKAAEIVEVCMEEAAKVVEEGFDRPVGKAWRHDGQRSKLDLCTHGLPMTETCEPCIAAALRALRGEGGVDDTNQR